VQGDVAILNGGERISADYIFLCTGVKPCLDFAKDKLLMNKGLLTNEYQQTSDENIYAAGDVVEGVDLLKRERSYIAIVPNAVEQARVAAENMCYGNLKKYEGSLSMNSVVVFGQSVMSAGYLFEEDAQVFSSRENGIYRKFFFKEGRLIGYILVNDVESVGALLYLLKSGYSFSADEKRALEKDTKTFCFSRLLTPF
jgi:NAD(P)H-nitrite reductase large subunit